MELTIRMTKAPEMRKALAAGLEIPSRPPELQLEFEFGTFTQTSNKLSSFVRKKFKLPPSQVIYFLYTESQRPAENPVDSLCRPDYIVVFGSNITSGRGAPWPWMEVVGEKASKGDKDPLQKTLSYLHYWLLARPDRKAGVSFLVSSEGVTFFVAYQGNPEVQSTLAKWGSPELLRLMFALVYCLYHQESRNWVNPEYVKKKKENNDGTTTTIFDIQLGSSPLPPLKDFKSVYSRTPFGTRTHVFVNPQSEVVVQGKAVTVVKDELARTGTRFTEKEVYERIHSKGPVPGLAQPSFYHVIKDTLHHSRERRLTGLQEYGHGIMMAKSLRQVLELVFDVLELLRHLYVKHRVLHRDISRGNIMFVETPTIPPISEVKQHKDLCFSRHLLDPENHPNPLETSVLLIDFNNAEILDEKHEYSQEGSVCTGTPGFIARAVQRGEPMPQPPRSFVVAEIPDAPEAYKSKHPERMCKFPPKGDEVHSPPTGDYRAGWRHDLDHEAESVFWVLVYWLMAASPVGLPEERIDKGVFNTFSGNGNNRHKFVSGSMEDIGHSYSNAVVPLIENIGAILKIDRFWLPVGSPRKNPEYAGEAFQRLVLSFLADHRDEEFMNHEIDRDRPRIVEKKPEVLTVHYMTSQLQGAEHSEQQRKKRKLDLDAHPTDNDRWKRRQVDEESGPCEQEQKYVREEDLEPESAFPDGFEAQSTAKEKTHCFRFREVQRSGQVEVELMELSPEEVARREAMKEADESEEEGESD